MSKQIKLVKDNEVAIVAALHAANGKATAHAYTSFAEIERIAAIAESKLETLLGGKANWTGVIVNDRSGSELPNTYKYSRSCTALRLVRKTTGWFIDSLASVTAYKEAGKTSITLTQAQDTLAIERLRKHYTVAKPAATAL
jgi:hypothetical protein